MKTCQKCDSSFIGETDLCPNCGGVEGYVVKDEPKKTSKKK